MEKKNKILLVDVDSKIPNIALMKLSTFFKNKGNSVELKKLGLTYYKKPENRIIIDGSDYDAVYISIVFKINKESLKVINCDDVQIGGIGYDLSKKLPKEIDDLPEDYTIYPDNNCSYGFITRGCIRNCYFCIVPKKEGMIHKYRDPSDIIKHKKVIFMDNNILAYEGHKEILKELRDKKVKCQFNQGLDIRKIDDENAKLLSELNYFGEYYFAFDDLKIEPIILEKLEIIHKYITKDWKLKMFLYCNPNMDLVNDVVYRVNFCKNHKILPYLMRDQSCWDSENNEFYIDLCAWCNQPGLFKKMKFEEFMQKRTNNEDRRKNSIALYTGL